MNVTLDQIIKILFLSSAVVTNDYAVVYGQVYEEPEEDILFEATWEDEGREFSCKFLKKDNSNACLVDSSLFLFDEKGDEWQLTPLFSRDLETVLAE